MRSGLPALLLVALLVVSGCVVVQRSGTAPAPQGSGTPSAPGQSGDGYRFVHTRPNGEPVRWSTCDPISYVVRPKNRPPGARRLLRASIERISEATGLQFSYKGTTREDPRKQRKVYAPDRYGDQWAPVLIAYSSPAEYPRLKGQAVGYGGAFYVRVGSKTPRYVSGMVVFDAPQMASMSDDQVKAVMMHELAHVVGLAHVRDRDQLMNAVQYARGVTELGAGDLTGLEALGNGRCYEKIEPRPLHR